MKKQRKYLVKQIFCFVMALTLCMTSFGTGKVYATEADSETVSITIDNSISHLAVRFYPDTNDMENFNVAGVGYTETFTVAKGSVARIRLYVQADGHCVPENYVIEGATRLTDDDRINYGWCRAAFTITADATKTIVIPEAPVCEHPYADPNVRWGYYDCGDGTHAQSCTLCSSDIEGTSANHKLSEMTATEYADWYYDDDNFKNMSEETIASNKARMVAYITEKLGVDANTKIKCCTVCEHYEKIEIPATGNVWQTSTDTGKSYWYEDGVKQGTYDDPKGVLGDGTVRGREIYDPVSDGWYWLDAVYDGARAVNKEVWMPYIYQDEADWEADEIRMNAENSGDMAEQVIREINNRTGKWVRYDENGKMYKGWYKVEGEQAEIYPDQVGNIYYYDHQTGLMAKGEVEIDGVTYYFDTITGVLQK